MVTSSPAIPQLDLLKPRLFNRQKMKVQLVEIPREEIRLCQSPPNPPINAASSQQNPKISQGHLQLQQPLISQRTLQKGHVQHEIHEH